MKGIEISASDLIPSGLQDSLMALANTGDLTEWSIGDMAEDFFALYWHDIKAEFPGATKKAVYNAIGSFCGRKGDTVRMYHNVSKGVSNLMREEFDVLGRHHHKAILTYSKGEAAEHRRLCLWWLSKADEFGGKIGPVHALEQALRENSEPNPDPAWLVRLERTKAQLRKLILDEDAPEETRDRASLALVALEGDPRETLVDVPVEGGGVRIDEKGIKNTSVSVTTEGMAVVVEGVEIFVAGAPVAHVEEVENPDAW